VLPVALLKDPCSRQVAISLNELTLTSVDPASVITPFDVSRICIGGFPGRFTFPPCPFAVSDLFKVVGSSKSRTSSFRIFHIKISQLDTHHTIPTFVKKHTHRSIHILETSGRKIFSKLLQEYTYNSHSTSNQKLLDLDKQYGINISLSSVKSLTDEGAV